MTMTFTKRMGVAAVLALGATGSAKADEVMMDGRWVGRVPLMWEMSVIAPAQVRTVPVVTTASVPPRSPRTLAKTAPRTPKPTLAKPNVNYLHVAAFEPVKLQPLFWLTVGNGF
jgi:hypothetical protein